MLDYTLVLDLPYYRSSEERDLLTLELPFLDNLLINSNAPPIEICDFFPPLTEMSCNCTDQRWVRDDDFEHCFRCLHYE